MKTISFFFSGAYKLNYNPYALQFYVDFTLEIVSNLFITKPSETCKFLPPFMPFNGSMYVLNELAKNIITFDLIPF